MQWLMDKYEYYIVKWFGYGGATRIEDGAVWLGGFFLGIIVMALLAGFFMLRLHALNDYGKSQLRLLRVDHGKKSTMIISKKNVWETFEQILLLSFSPFFTINRFTSRDARRTKRFVRIMGVVAILALLYSVLAIFSVLHPI